MKFCPNCRSGLSDDVLVCGMCGYNFTQPGAAAGQFNQPFNDNRSGFYPPPYYAPPRYFARLNTGMLVWSILCAATLFAGNYITGVLGIIASVYTVMARDEKSPQGEADKLRIAKTLDIIATIVFFLFLILVIAAAVLFVVMCNETGWYEYI
ncbi:MAG: hypothetical protein GX051_03355 [Clostridiales bacterium]|nr:hypothetical protein [Clostridiales bacterium]